MLAGDVQEDLEKAKRRAASLSLSFNALQSLLKIGAAVITGSVSVLSEAVHSSTDVVASLMAYVGVRAAAAPPDEEHPYGHGKIESLAGFGESILLLMIVIYIVIQSIQKLFSGSGIERPDFGMAVMAASALGAVGVGVYVSHVGK